MAKAPHRRVNRIPNAAAPALLLAVAILLSVRPEYVRPAAARPPGSAASPGGSTSSGPLASGLVPAGAMPSGEPGPLVGPPARLRIPRLGVDTPLRDLGLSSTGELDPPTNYTDAGWYADGTAPGDVGPAVLAGHVDSTKGPAVFYRLSDLRPGDVIQVDRGGEWLQFQVQTVTRYPKDEFPTAAVYGPTPDPELRLITCGGTFDRSRRSYADNVVVFAVMVGR
jgi:LPXTG-site transpeptidase (sortase) family protein